MTTPPSPSDLSALVHPKERRYFAIGAAFGILIYGIVIYVFLTNKTAGPTILTYAIMLVVFTLAAHGFMLGHIRGNAVLVSARQFPRLHAIVAENATILDMQEPSVFVLQSGGVLNAFATRFLGRNFVVLYSDVLSVAEHRGERAVSFIVGHELGHLKRGHLKYRWLLAPARLIPFLGGAYSRACEYTCDRFGAACAPDGAVSGLLTLAAGRDLYSQVEPGLYAAQTDSEAGFWTSVAEVFASHPHLTKRVRALLETGHGVPTYTPIESLRMVAQSAPGD